MDVQEFKDLVIAKNIRFIPHHKCGICGCWVGYYINVTPDKNVTAEYGSACDCRWAPDHRVPLDDAARWFEGLSDYERNAIFVSF